MVKKAVVGLAFVVILSAFGAGIFVGMQAFGGASAEPAADGDGSATTDDGGGDDAATATATETNETTPTNETTDTNETTEPEPTPTATPTPTPSEQEPYIPPSYFDEAAIEQHVAEHVNRERQSRVLDSLRNTGTTANELSAMARGHSQNMAREGQTVHTIDGKNSHDRYQDAGLAETCKYQRESYIQSSRDNAFESLGRTTAGTVYTEDGEERLNRDEEEVADAVVTEMFNSVIYSDRLTYEGTTRVGVGANVTAEGRVYVTVNVCG
jgi:uncharacterized protein YkwD